MVSALHPQCAYDGQCGNVTVHISEGGGPLSITIETLRLKILSVNTDEYEKDLIKLYGDKKVNALVGSGATLEETAVHEKIQRWIKRWSEHTPLSGYVVLKKDTHEFVGQIILKPVKDKSQAELVFFPSIIEIGYLSLEKHWGQGYGKEFTHAMVYHLVPELITKGFSVKNTPIKTIMATSRLENLASNRILAKFLSFRDVKPRYGALRAWYEHHYS